MNYDDAEAVYSELRWVRDQGFKVWYDEGISPGHTWQDELAEKIDSCSLFLLFVSPKAVMSRNCLRETAYAVTRDKEFLAIYLEETELPSGLALEIGDRQAILKDRFPADIYQGKVIDALSSYLPVPSTDKAADRDEPAAESREPAAIAEGAQLSTRLRAVVAFSAVVVIVLIAFLWRFPVYIPGSDTAVARQGWHPGSNPATC